MLITYICPRFSCLVAYAFKTKTNWEIERKKKFTRSGFVLYTQQQVRIYERVLSTTYVYVKPWGKKKN